MTIVIKDAEKTLRFKHLIYEKFSVDVDDPVVGRCIHESLKSFTGEPTDVQIKISMTV